MAKRRLMVGIIIGMSMVAGVCSAADQRVQRVEATPFELRPLPSVIHGRGERESDMFVRQWPGSYGETAFRGPAALFKVGAGEVALHVFVDGHPIATLFKPAPGLYRLAGLSSGRHQLRVEVASESQVGPTNIGPFYSERGTVPAALPKRTGQIEFVGDSHTVGYGVKSTKRECTQDEVWAMTDTSQSFGVMLARRYNADYEVNAISGRGVVRNYNGFAADKLPEAYPFVLLDHKQRAAEPAWHPQVIVISLGTNDFTTPLHADEKWKDRDALHNDYEATYARFVHGIRAQNPRALIVLWATDMADGEIEAEVTKVVARLRAAGEQRLAYVPVNGLSFSGCNSHPSLADQAVIAGRIEAAIDAHLSGWPTK